MSSYFYRASIKRILSAGLVMSLVWSSLPAQQAEARTAAAVSVPGFTVQVNGVLIDNARQRYPFLVYRDITYLPLTWDNTQALGLQADWNGSEGLSIYKKHSGGGGGDWKPAGVQQDLSGSHAPHRKYQASIADYPVSMPRVGRLDQASEPYPFLEFRDVTYMPLTWRFSRELLGLEIQWDGAKGLAITGGQELIGYVFYDDADYLYAYPRLSLDAAHRVLKIPKTLQGQPIWLTEAESRPLEEKMYTGRRDVGSEPVTLEQRGNELYIGDSDTLLHKLTEEESRSLGEYPPIYEAVRFPIDDKRSLVSLHIYWSVPKIGPPPGSYHHYMDNAGALTEFSSDLSYFRPERVLPNPDGTVWIAKSYNEQRYGPAMLYLLDTKGMLHDVNNTLLSSDIVTLGSLNQQLDNPASADGSLIVQLTDNWSGPGQNRLPKEEWGLYRLDTKLNASKLNYPDDGQLYMGSGHELFLIRSGTNTIIDLPRNLSRTWLDQELF
ncbi:hypothetical protein [Paenibacillus puerhi]|uniref:hypothetical protein n=1 Tax=Paenibacillus puerhi TaxID=2692622 RepID=UPI00135CD4F3|nr:hypothetical protein [Paenibacillus puerhi]